MKGITYLVDETGNRTGVILDLRAHGRLWEDIQDRLMIESRRSEPRVTLSAVRQRLTRARQGSRRSGTHG